MDYKRVLKVIKITDEIVDLNPEIKKASRKTLGVLIKQTKSMGGGILIWDFFDKKLKLLSKKGRLRKKPILDSFNKAKRIVKGKEIAVPVVISGRRLGVLYLYGKKYTRDDVEYVSAAETILDGRFRHEIESTGLKSIFERYVGEKTMKKILKHSGEDEIKGKTHICTILFADINNFTHYANTHRSKKVVKFLNNYFEKMSRVVLKRDGTIDKFIGDAIMVVFGSPVTQKDHASKAIETAKDMIVKMRKIFREYKFVRGGLSVGIATGRAVVGNVGSKKMKDYTVIGRKVNLASRLTSVAGKNQIVVDEATKRSVRKFRYKDLGKIEVKGFVKKPKLFRVILAK